MSRLYLQRNPSGAIRWRYRMRVRTPMGARLWLSGSLPASTKAEALARLTAVRREWDRAARAGLQ